MTPGPRAADRYCLLVPLVAVPLLLSLPFFFGQVFLFRDIVTFDVPQQVLVARALHAGRLPEWSPFVFGGTPLLAEPETAVFYPLNWLFLFLDPWRAATLFVLLNLPLAAWGSLLLARRLQLSNLAAATAASGYVASGYLLSMNGGHYYAASAALLPLVLALGLKASAERTRRAVAFAGLALAFLLLSGDFQALLVAVLIAYGLTLAELPRSQKLREFLARAAALSGSIALGCALGAAQLLPSFLLGRTSTREAGVPLAEAASWALHPARLADFFVPQPWGLPYPENGFWGHAWLNGLHNVPWAPSLWLGTLLPLLALSTPLRSRPGLRRALAAVAITCLICAMGTYTPAYVWARHLVPLFDRFRYPEKLAMPATLAIAMLGAARIDDLAQAPARKTAAWTLGLAALIFAVLAAFAIAQPRFLMRALSLNLRLGEANLSAVQAAHNLTGALVESCLLCAVGLLACAAAVRRPVLLPALFLAAIAIAQTANGFDVLSYGSAAQLREEPPLVAGLRAAIPPGSAGRVLSEDNCRLRDSSDTPLLEKLRAFQLRSGRANLLSLFGLPDAIGYGAIEWPEQLALFHALARLGRAAVVRAFGAAVEFGCDSSGEREIKPVLHPLPRVRVARAIAAPASIDAAAQALVEASERGYPTALVSPEDLPRVPVATAPGRAEVVGEIPERIVVHASGGGGLLVLADRLLDGWSVAVDGAPAQILRTDLLWRGASLPPGEHEIVFSYRTPGLRPGIAISLAAMLVVALLALRKKRDDAAARPL